MWRAAVLLLCTASAPLAACTCTSYEPVRACERYHDSPAVLRGRVLDDNDDRSGGFGQLTLYRFEVLEAFKGLSPQVREIFIDPGSGSSCYTNFEAGTDYLLFLANPLAGARVRDYFGANRAGTPGKPFPAAWKGREEQPVYLSGTCSPVRRVKPDDADLQWLRSPGKDDPRALGWVEGRAVQNRSRSTLAAEAAPAADATVTVTARGAFRSDARTDSEGAFRLDRIPPGEILLQVTSPLLGKLYPAAGVPLRVRPGGCTIVHPSYETQASISGRVTDAEGRPAQHIRVELGRRLDSGRIRTIPGTWANTDGEGRYTIRSAPTGPVLLAANMNGAPETRMPFDPVYAPGTQDPAAARVFRLGPDEQARDVDLRLPPPLPFGKLHVEVLWPDGSPATGGARASADYRGERADFRRADEASHRVDLHLALGRSYKIGADWLRISEKFEHVPGTPQTVEFTRDGQTLQIRLQVSRPK